MRVSHNLSDILLLMYLEQIILLIFLSLISIYMYILYNTDRSDICNLYQYISNIFEFIYIKHIEVIIFYLFIKYIKFICISQKI